MVTDDMSLQNELVAQANKLVDENGRNEDLTVEEAVDFYMQAYFQKVRQHAERHILIKQGMTYASFEEKERNGELSDKTIELIRRDLAAHRLPYNIQTIIAGCDSKGAHIYVIDNDDVIQETETGYA